MNYKKGKLIIVDGIDGSGKTTQAKLLFEEFKKAKKKAVCVKEPDNKKLIKFIKENKDPLIDLLLFLADRRQGYQKINQLLSRGFIVISDRSFPSTLVYQYYMSNLKNEFEENFLFYLDHLSRFHLEPDLVFIFDLLPKIALQRLKSKLQKSKISKFEEIKFLFKARRGFLYFAKKFKWQIIDASKSVEKVRLSIKKVIQNKLGLLK